MSTFFDRNENHITQEDVNKFLHEYNIQIAPIQSGEDVDTILFEIIEQQQKQILDLNERVNKTTRIIQGIVGVLKIYGDD